MSTTEALFLTVPTRGDHPELLERLVRESGLPPDHVIIVRTSPTADVPSDVVVLDDFGEINIHRWWNRGIAEGQRRGASAVGVLNDDIVIGPGALHTLQEQMAATGAALATPGDVTRLHKGHLPGPRVVVGSLWLIDVSQELRPDESFRWWFGDDDLDVRARSRHGGIATVPVNFEHLHASESSDSSSALQSLIDVDRATFRRKHPLVAGRRRLLGPRYGRTARLLRMGQ